MLAFIGIRPGMVALDVSAGGGYTTELVARGVGPTGRVYGQSAPRPARAAAGRSPKAPQRRCRWRSCAGAPPPRPAANLGHRAGRTREESERRATSSLSCSPSRIRRRAECASNCLDLVTLMFNYHDLGSLGVDRAAMNRAIFAALKPGGMYVIADHSGRPGTGISESGTLHRIEEAFLRAEVEQAGLSASRPKALHAQSFGRPARPQHARAAAAQGRVRAEVRQALKHRHEKNSRYAQAPAKFLKSAERFPLFGLTVQG